MNYGNINELWQLKCIPIKNKEINPTNVPDNLMCIYFIPPVLPMSYVTSTSAKCNGHSLPSVSHIWSPPIQSYPQNAKGQVIFEI